MYSRSQNIILRRQFKRKYFLNRISEIFTIPLCFQTHVFFSFQIKTTHLPEFQTYNFQQKYSSTNGPKVTNPACTQGREFEPWEAQM